MRIMINALSFFSLLVAGFLGRELYEQLYVLRTLDRADFAMAVFVLIVSAVVGLVTAYKSIRD
jgi:hypothetical protein